MEPESEPVLAWHPARGKHALVIGISEYDDEEVLRPLPEAKEDAALSEGCLTDLGFEVLRPHSTRQGRLKLPDLRDAVRTFKTRVEGDVRCDNPVAIVVVACHAVQAGASQFPELFTSEWSAGGSTFSVSLELVKWLNSVRNPRGPCRGLDCLMVFDCCRHSSVFGTDPGTSGFGPWRPDISSNFYLVFSCEPGMQAEPEGGLVREVMDLLRFQLPLTELLHLAVRRYLSTREVCQRPTVDCKPGVEVPVLGTEPWVQETKVQETNPADSRLAAIVGSERRRDLLMQILSGEGRPFPVSFGRRLQEEEPLVAPRSKAIDITWKSRSVRIIAASLLNDLADIVPGGVHAFLVILSEWSFLEQLCTLEEAAEAVHARTVAIASVNETPAQQNHQKVLQIDLMEQYARDKVLEEVTHVADEMRKPFDSQAFANARKRRDALESLLQQLPSSVREDSQLRLHLAMLDRGEVSCSQVIEFVLMMDRTHTFRSSLKRPWYKQCTSVALIFVTPFLVLLCLVFLGASLVPRGIPLHVGRRLRSDTPATTWSLVFPMLVTTCFICGRFLCWVHWLRASKDWSDSTWRSRCCQCLCALLCYLAFLFEHLLLWREYRQSETLPSLELTNAGILLVMSGLCILDLRELCLDNWYRLVILSSMSVAFCVLAVRRGIGLISPAMETTCQGMWWCWEFPRFPFWLLVLLLGASVVATLVGHVCWHVFFFKGATRLLLSDFRPILALWTWCLGTACFGEIAVLAINIRLSFPLTWLQRCFSCVARDIVVCLLSGLWHPLEPPQPLWSWFGQNTTCGWGGRGRHGQTDQAASRELARIVLLAEVAGEVGGADLSPLQPRVKQLPETTRLLPLQELTLGLDSGGHTGADTVLAHACGPGKKALVICISEYDDKFLCSLPHVEKDAAAAVMRLQSLNFEVLRPYSHRPGRLELEDLRKAVQMFRERVEEDACAENPLAAIVVACHGVQTNSHCPELLTSDYSGQTFSVLRELFKWLEVVRTRGGVCRGLDCLMIFDCCRQSKTWGTQTAQTVHFPAWNSNFYLLYSCDPGGEEGIQGGLVQEVMHVLQFSLPLSVVLFLSVENFVARRASQRPWVECKPGIRVPILGTRNIGPGDPNCPLSVLSVVLLGKLGMGSHCDRLVHALCPDTAEATAVAPVVVGRVTTGPRAKVISNGARLFRIILDANSFRDIAQLTPNGVDVFLLNVLDWDHMETLWGGQDQRTITEILDRTVAVADGVQTYDCKSTLQVDWSEPSEATCTQVLGEVVRLAQGRQPLDGEAFRTARFEWLLLQQYVDRLREPPIVRDRLSEKLQTWMDDGSVNCFDCIRFVLNATRAQLEEVTRSGVMSKVVKEVVCKDYDSELWLPERRQQGLLRQDLQSTRRVAGLGFMLLALTAVWAVLWGGVEVDPPLLPFVAIGAPGWTALFVLVVRGRLCRERKLWFPLLVYLSNILRYLSPHRIPVEVTLFMINLQVYFGLCELGLCGRYHQLIQIIGGLTATAGWAMGSMMGHVVSRFLAVLLAAFWVQAVAFAASVVVSSYNHVLWLKFTWLFRGTTERLLSEELQPRLSLWSLCLACNCLSAVQVLLVCSLWRVQGWQRPFQWVFADATLSGYVFILAGPWRVAERPKDLWCWLGQHATSPIEPDVEALWELSRMAIRAEASGPWPRAVARGASCVGGCPELPDQWELSRMAIRAEASGPWPRAVARGASCVGGCPELPDHRPEAETVQLRDSDIFWF